MHERGRQCRSTPETSGVGGVADGARRRVRSVIPSGVCSGPGRPRPSLQYHRCSRHGSSADLRMGWSPIVGRCYTGGYAPTRVPRRGPAHLACPAEPTQRGRSVQAPSADRAVRVGTDGMPPPWVYRGSDGSIMIYNSVTRATRVARLAPGTTIKVEVVREARVPLGHLPTIGDLIP